MSGLVRLEHDEAAARFVLNAVEAHHVVVRLAVQLREVGLDDVVALLEKHLLLRVLVMGRALQDHVLLEINNIIIKERQSRCFLDYLKE